MINNIKNNTISEALAKQKLDALNEIKKAEIKNKRLISTQTKLLNLFDDLLEATFNNKSVSNIDDNVSVHESLNESVNESVNDDHDDNDGDNKDEDCYMIMQLNNYFKTIDEIKSFEEQIELLKKETF